VLAKLFRKVEKDAGDLAFFLAAQILQLVVGFDRFQRFDKDGRPARRRTVRDARDLAPEIGFDWNDKPVVPYRDDLVLDRVAGGPHCRLKRFCKTGTLCVDLTPQSCQLRRSRIVDLTTRKQLFINFLDYCKKLRRQIFDRLPKRGGELLFGLQSRAGKQSLAAYAGDLKQKDRFKRRIFDPQDGDGTGRVFETTERPRDLLFFVKANGLFDRGESFFELDTIFNWASCSIRCRPISVCALRLTSKSSLSYSSVSSE
jgi:hypothetical protein